MRKQILPILLIFTSSLLLAQQDALKDIALTTSILQVNAGFTNITDPYLSPFSYNGWHIGAKQNNRRFLNKNAKAYTLLTQYKLNGGRVYHPRKASAMLFFGANILTGVEYNITPYRNLHISFGGGGEVGIGGKYLSRNINNPVSFDFYSSLVGIANIDYRFKLWRIPFRVNYGLDSPILGFMFVPQQGSTYYEILSLKNNKNTIHLSHFLNRQTINHHLDLDIRFRPITLRLGVAQNYKIYQANNMVFRQNDFTFSIGTVINIYRYFGRESNKKGKFISPDTFYKKQMHTK